MDYREQKPSLCVRHLTSRLKIGQGVCKVVDDLSFDLWPGKTLALVGESGSGKTMTALSIMRILPQTVGLPSEGEVWYAGKNILTLSEKEMRCLRGGKLAMIFQDPTTSLNPVYTIESQLSEVVELHLGLFGEAARLKVIKALADVGIYSPEEHLNAYPHQLSGGMKQRIMIAMALLCEPDILIADEPTTALDVTIQAQVLELMRELQVRKQMALLLITHDLGVVAEMADEVIVMYATQAVECGPVLPIFDQMSHPYTQGLFKSRPTQYSPGQLLTPIKGNVPTLTHLPSGCRFHTRCPYVMPICKKGEVPDFPMGALPHSPEGLSLEMAPGTAPHHTRCWLYDGREESLQKLYQKAQDATAITRTPA